MELSQSHEFIRMISQDIFDEMVQEKLTKQDALEETIQQLNERFTRKIFGKIQQTISGRASSVYWFDCTFHKPVAERRYGRLVKIDLDSIIYRDESLYRHLLLLVS